MSRSVQMSAAGSPETKDLSDAFARAAGIKKARLVEDAVHQCISALESLPPEAIVHSRVIIGRDSAEQVALAVKQSVGCMAWVGALAVRG